MPEVREQPPAAALSAAHYVVPHPSTPHPIPAGTRTQQQSAELLQARHSGEGRSHRGSAGPDPEQPRDAAAAAQR